MLWVCVVVRCCWCVLLCVVVCVIVVCGCVLVWCVVVCVVVVRCLSCVDVGCLPLTWVGSLFIAHVGWKSHRKNILDSNFTGPSIGAIILHRTFYKESFVFMYSCMSSPPPSLFTTHFHDPQHLSFRPHAYPSHGWGLSLLRMWDGIAIVQIYRLGILHGILYELYRGYISLYN